MVFGKFNQELQLKDIEPILGKWYQNMPWENHDGKKWQFSNENGTFFEVQRLENMKISKKKPRQFSGET